jgi:hypothetical protein
MKYCCWNFLTSKNYFEELRNLGIMPSGNCKPRSVVCTIDWQTIIERNSVRLEI